ncbi:PKD domain-containing protein [Chondrinema litorale]|uniref:PKD domain-containing protein n=1 Tax=Chondrinema litorale TaxID=2994555 RepID=UPI002543EBE4|nr:PKD domain-containing protein [Chondrinema litorale]UZR92674.1 PKD domain-containing protein [Chondrinema litorale]
MFGIADNYKLIFSALFLHLSITLSAQDNCKIPSITATTLGNEQSCDPIDFGYILEGYTDNDANTVYEIDFGDGTNLILTHDQLDADGEHLLTHTYSQVSCATPQKAYTFTVVAGANCTTFPKTVSIFPVITGQPPTPGFATNLEEGCVNEPLTFLNTSTDGFNFQCETTAEYNWDFGDGTVITTEEKDPIDHSFPNVGVYEVVLTVVQECGVYELTQSVTINGPPIPIFEIGNLGNVMTIEDCAGDVFIPLNACTRPIIVPIRSISTGGGLTETWDITPATGATFSNGNRTSDEAEEVITFTEAGTYRLNLTTTSNCGSENSCVTIIIPDIPAEEDITIVGLENIASCAPATLDFSVETEVLGVDAYQWQITGTNGTANPAPAADFNTANPAPFTLQAGTYDISITVSNDCGDATVTESIEIINLADPVINPAIPAVCENETLELSTQQVAGATYEWFFNGELIQNESGSSITRGEPGLYSVRVTLGNCTKTSADAEMVIKPAPIAEITPQTEIVFCEDENISAVLEANAGAGLTYQWLLNGSEVANATNQTLNVSAEGEYSVLVNQDGCVVESEVVEVSQVPYPEVSLNIDNSNAIEICPSEPITLTASGAEEYIWEPAEGLNTTTGATVVATPLQSTTYTVRGINGGRCEDVKEIEIIVLPLPDITLPEAEVCVDGTPFQLDVEINSAGSGVWEASDLPAGAISADGMFNPAIAGANEAGHEISYRFTQPNGCQPVFTQIVVVHELPQPEFNIPASVCVGSGFIPDVLSDDLPDNTYEWEIDGTFYSNERTPDFLFNTESTHEITLRVTSGDGCVNEVSQTVDVQGEVFNPSFSLDIAADNNCTPLEVGFNNDNVDNNVTYQWDFGNGNSSNQSSPANQTYEAGALGDTIYYVTMEAVTACGTFTITDSVEVKANVNADFGVPADTVYSNLPVSLPNLSTGTADSYTWDFGDGTDPVIVNDTTATIHNFVYFGATDTTYTVTLTAQNECNTSTISKEITVYPNVFFEVSPVVGCEPLTVNFSTNLTDALAIVWLWGDVQGNGTSGGADQTYTYQEAGVYEPSLIVAYDFGRTDTFTTIINVLPTLEASFEVEGELCVGSPITFVNTSEDAIGSTWDFGDGETFQGVNPPAKTYNRPGTYEVSLTVVNPINNCPGTYTQEIFIPDLTASFEASNNIICIGQPITFNNTSTDAKSYRWTFNDGTNVFNSLSASPEWIFETEGINTVTLEVFSEPNLSGCTEVIEETINVVEGPEISFSINKDAICGIWYISVENESNYPTDPSNGMLYWNFGNGNTYEGFEDIPVQQFIYSEDEGISSYEITLTAETKDGCIETLSIPFEIEDCCNPLVYLPEDGRKLAFSPFNGGQNDLFMLKTEFVEEYDLRIYDKWDRMVFQTHDTEEGWDGRFAGSAMPAGVYKGVVSYGGCRLGDKIEPVAKVFLLYLID